MNFNEYSQAMTTFLYGCIDPLMRAMDPVYSQIPRLQTPTANVAPTPIGNQEFDNGPPIRVSTDFVFSLERAIAGDSAEVAEVVELAARQAIEQIMPALYGNIDRVTEATGNVIDAGGKFDHDTILDMLDRIHVAEFDENGVPKNLMMVVASDVAEKVRNLAPPTPEQQQRYEAIMRRKREEANASRRNRRLS